MILGAPDGSAWCTLKHSLTRKRADRNTPLVHLNPPTHQGYEEVSPRTGSMSIQTREVPPRRGGVGTATDASTHFVRSRTKERMTRATKQSRRKEQTKEDKEKGRACRLRQRTTNGRWKEGKEIPQETSEEEDEVHTTSPLHAQ